MNYGGYKIKYNKIEIQMSKRDEKYNIELGYSTKSINIST